MKETYEFLKKCNIFYVATIDGDNPRVRPFGALNMYDNKIYLVTGKVKNVSKQLNINNNVEICGMCNGEWIRVSGKLINDDNREAKIDMLKNNPDLTHLYSADDDNMQVLYLSNVISTISSFTSEPIIYTF